MDEWTNMIYIKNSYYEFVRYLLALAIAFVKEEPFPYLSRKVQYFLKSIVDKNGDFYFIENHIII